MTDRAKTGAGARRRLVFLTACCYALALSAGCAGREPTAAGTMEKEESGTPVAVEAGYKDDALKERVLAAASRLEEQAYISLATVDFDFSPADEGKVCFFASLDGDRLGEHLDEIVELIAQDADDIDLDNSVIVDVKGGTLYPEAA